MNLSGSRADLSRGNPPDVQIGLLLVVLLALCTSAFAASYSGDASMVSVRRNRQRLVWVVSLTVAFRLTVPAVVPHQFQSTASEEV
jgi:hypothetical protein